MDKKTCDTFLVITATRTPGTATISSGINSEIDSYGANLCYSFSHTEISAKPSNVFELRSKGKVICGNPVCAQALFMVKDTVKISISSPGIYLLKFFNEHSLYKTDTVQVN